MTKLAVDTSKHAYLSTYQAATVLNLSVSTVQKLVENNELLAWKTRGGHRRISFASVESYRKHRLHHDGYVEPSKHAELRVIFVDSNKESLASVEMALRASPLALRCNYLTSGVEAMFWLADERYDVIFTELDLVDLDGAELLRKLDNRSSVANMNLVAWTRLDASAIESRGGLPARAVVLQKSVHPAWITGYLTAFSNLKFGRSELLSKADDCQDDDAL